MAEVEVRYDRRRPDAFFSEDVGYPITIDGAEASYVTDRYVRTKLDEMTTTIQAKRPEYTYHQAVEWAARRAVERTGAREGKVYSDRSDVN